VWNDWKPTGELRFVEKESDGQKLRILQQRWAPDVPSYMISGEGEWREVPLVVEETA